MKKILLITLLLTACSDRKKIDNIYYSFASKTDSLGEIMKISDTPCLNVENKLCISIVLEKGSVIPLTAPINDWQMEQVLSYIVLDPSRTNERFLAANNCQIDSHKNCITTEKINYDLARYLKAP